MILQNQTTMAKHLLFLILLTSVPLLSKGQAVYYHVSNTAVYEFLDELAADTIIQLNSVVKPYSRKFIAEKLNEANTNRGNLNQRERDDLDFYLKDFNKELRTGENYPRRRDLFFYKNDLFTISADPILGGQFFFNKNGFAYHRWGGGEFYGYVGSHWGFYANLRDNHESKAFEEPEYLTPRTGGNYKHTKDGGVDYSEMRGGITYAYKWGTFALIKDHVVWGNNYHGSNILSGKTPSFLTLKFDIQPVEWFEFHYFHGWLVSNVIDSARSYSFNTINGMLNRDIFYKKFMAANLFTIHAWENIACSFGNSIIYSDNSMNPVYLIPFFFYKSVDQSMNSADRSANNVGQNSQMFLDISCRKINHLHVFTTVFMDELNTKNMFNKKKQSNFFSYKVGLKVSDLPPNLFLTLEYTRSNPCTYKHFVPTTTFESNDYTLGHYLKDNSDEFFTSLVWKPIKSLRLELAYCKARRGTDYIYTGVGTSGSGLAFIDSVKWRNETIAFKASYQVINDLFIFAEFYNDSQSGIEDYTPAYFRRKTNTFSIGANFGF
jgi:hypothetical protein